jgi:hypothetical protein
VKWLGERKNKQSLQQTMVQSETNPRIIVDIELDSRIIAEKLNCISILSVEGGDILFVYNMEIAQL